MPARAGSSEADGQTVAGLPVPVRLKRHARARRISLRLDQGGRVAVVVLPPGVAAADGLAFARQQAEWVRRRLDRLPAPVTFAPGVVIPLEGVPHRLLADGNPRGGVWLADGEVRVAGRPEFFARRVEDWLKRRAREALAVRVELMAASVGRRVTALSVRDPVSRWGSCTASGRLAFSWRLVLAPPGVLAYVAAHEVAHLVEMNHSPAFWRVVAGLCADAAQGRDWLKRHGRDLHRYGRA